MLNLKVRIRVSDFPLSGIGLIYRAELDSLPTKAGKYRRSAIMEQFNQGADNATSRQMHRHGDNRAHLI